LINLQLFAQEEKTEEATPHRLQEVRKKGQVARSNDLSTALVMMATIVVLYLRREDFYIGMTNLVTTFIRTDLYYRLDTANLFQIASYLIMKVGSLLAPVLLVAAVVGLTANFVQTGFIFSLEPIVPRLENINPLKGFQRIFSRRAVVELAKSLTKVLVVSVVAFLLVKGHFAQLLMTPDMGLLATIELVAGLLLRVGLGTVAAFLVIAVLDYIFQRKEFQRNIRMSKHEVREELKQMEGDPLVRSRLREKQRSLARHRMMHAVPEATVVVTNPTHMAVALRYREEEGAPRVVAKGAGSIAERIKTVARRHDVPVVENPPVARTLYYHVEIGQEIPFALYQAVAEILASIYRQKGSL